MNKISDCMDGYDGALPEVPTAAELSEKRIKELAMRKTGEKRPKGIKKSARILLIAAAIAAALTATVLASATPLKVSEEDAVEAVNGELEYFYEAGLFAEPIVIDESAEVKDLSSLGAKYHLWTDEHVKYSVNYQGEDFSCYAQIDAVTGKLTFVNFCNMDCHGMTPVSVFKYLDENGNTYIDPRTGVGRAFYNDYYRVIDSDLTIDGMFYIMCGYYGMESFELADEYAGVNAVEAASECFSNGVTQTLISAEFTDAEGNGKTLYVQFSPTASGSWVVFGDSYIQG